MKKRVYRKISIDRPGGIHFFSIKNSNRILNPNPKPNETQTKSSAPNSIAFTLKVETQRRLVLTGTPLQNNLAEYHCMVSFVKPNLLGTRKEFMNRFVNPINNGQHRDSTEADVRLMKKRAHVLHSVLDGCVQRKDYEIIRTLLPPKSEYVVMIRLSDTQRQLYRQYLEEVC